MLVIVLQQNMCARVCTSRLFRMPINFSIVPHFALDCSSLLVCVPHRLIWNNFSIPVVYSNLYLNFLQIVPKIKKNAPPTYPGYSRPILDSPFLFSSIKKIAKLLMTSLFLTSKRFKDQFNSIQVEAAISYLLADYPGKSLFVSLHKKNRQGNFEVPTSRKSPKHLDFLHRSGVKDQFNSIQIEVPMSQRESSKNYSL